MASTPPPQGYNLAFTRCSFTSSRLFTNQSSGHSSRPSALPTLLQYYCTTIGQYTTPPRPPCVYYRPYHIGNNNICKGQVITRSESGFGSRSGAPWIYLSALGGGVDAATLRPFHTDRDETPNHRSHRTSSHRQVLFREGNKADHIFIIQSNAKLLVSNEHAPIALSQSLQGTFDRSWLQDTLRRKLVDFAWNRRFFYLPGACSPFFAKSFNQPDFFQSGAPVLIYHRVNLG